MTDTTMRNLLDVYRVELNDRDEEIRRLGDDIEFWKGQHEKERKENYSKSDQIKKYRQQSEEQREKIAKLNQVIESLNLELANEREAHTKAREAAANPEETP